MRNDSCRSWLDFSNSNTWQLQGSSDEVNTPHASYCINVSYKLLVRTTRNAVAITEQNSAALIFALDRMSPTWFVVMTRCILNTLIERWTLTRSIAGRARLLRPTFEPMCNFSLICTVLKDLLIANPYNDFLPLRGKSHGTGKIFVLVLDR